MACFDGVTSLFWCTAAQREIRANRTTESFPTFPHIRQGNNEKLLYPSDSNNKQTKPQQIDLNGALKYMIMSSSFPHNKSMTTHFQA